MNLVDTKICQLGVLLLLFQHKIIKNIWKKKILAFMLLYLFHFLLLLWASLQMVFSLSLKTKAWWINFLNTSVCLIKFVSQHQFCCSSRVFRRSFPPKVLWCVDGLPQTPLVHGDVPVLPEICHRLGIPENSIRNF